MSEDFIEQTFSGLDVYYPGSKRKRREPAPPEITPKEGWEKRSYKKTLPNGKEVDMYTLGSLADALGRPIITIRQWMKAGYLPSSSYRMPTILDKNGEERQGRRLYTKPMIEAAVTAFTKAGVLHRKRVEWSLHRQLTREIDEAWKSILASETENTENGEN